MQGKDHSKCKLIGFSYKIPQKAQKEIGIQSNTKAYNKLLVLNKTTDILVIEKKRKEIIIIEVGIISQSQLITVETEKKRKYDILANNLGQLYKMKTKIILWVMTWDRIVTKMHKVSTIEIMIITV